MLSVVFSDSVHPAFLVFFLLFGFALTRVSAFLPHQDSCEEVLVCDLYFITLQYCISYLYKLWFFFLHAHRKRWIIFCIDNQNKWSYTKKKKQMPKAAREEVSSRSDMNEDSTNSYEHTNHMRIATWGY